MEIVVRYLCSVTRFLKQRGELFRWKQVHEPRSPRGRRYTLAAMLSTFVVALVAGATSVRRAAGKAHRFGGLRRGFLTLCRCGRSALAELLGRLDPRDLRAELVGFIRAEWRRKALLPDRLPLGAAAIDGKSVYAGPWRVHPEAQKQGDGFVLRVVRAVLVSCAACPILDQMVIPAMTNDMGVFQAFLEALMDAYGRLGMIQLVTADAGFTSLANATAVRAAGLHYVFALKRTQPELWREAHRVLGGLAEGQRAEATTPWEADSSRGTIRWRLWRTVDMAGWAEWNHLAQVWLVRVESKDERGRIEIVEDRFYLSSLPAYRLRPLEILAAVRYHWGIENNSNGSMDNFFREDDSPCSRSGQGLIAATLLRALAYNLAQIFRARRHRAPMTWADLFEDFTLFTRLSSAACRALVALAAAET